MKVVYVAGPFRASTAWGIEQNVRAAEVVALEVWRAGAVALCPHANSRHYHGAAADELFIEGTLELLRRCDAVLLIKGWKESEGSRGEKREADRLGLPVFFDVREVEAWLGDPLAVSVAGER
jgi:hypothetical protein